MVKENKDRPDIGAKLGPYQDALVTELFIFARLDTIHGRMAARAYAYSIAPTDTRGAERILDIVGREG